MWAAMWAVVEYAAYLYASCLVFSLVLCVWGFTSLAWDCYWYGTRAKPELSRHRL